MFVSLAAGSGRSDAQRRQNVVLRGSVTHGVALAGLRPICSTFGSAVIADCQTVQSELSPGRAVPGAPRCPRPCGWAVPRCPRRAGALPAPVHGAHAPLGAGQPQHRAPRQTRQRRRRPHQGGLEQVPEGQEGQWHVPFVSLHGLHTLLAGQEITCSGPQEILKGFDHFSTWEREAVLTAPLSFASLMMAKI